MKFILCIAYFVLNVSAFAQISTEYVATADINLTGWISYVDHQDFKIEYKRSDCRVNSGLDKQYFLVKITNKSQNEITLNWEMDLFYNDNCKTCGQNEYEWEATLAPNQSLEGECAVGAENTLRLFSKFIDAAYSSDAELTGFQFSNLQFD